MQTVSKRLLSLLLALLMVFSLIPVTALAAEEENALPEAITELTEAVTEAAQAVLEGEPVPLDDGSSLPYEITDYETFVMYLAALEEIAQMYALETPGTDPLTLIIKYIRTGVDRYNSGSWGIMAGYEDEGFAEYVFAVEDMLNAEVPEGEPKYYISSLKNVTNFYLPNGDYTDFGHMFGTMDITNHNSTSQNHADVGGWAGDLVDLLSTSDRHFVSGTLEEMVAEISEKYLGNIVEGESDQFGPTDMYGDLDAYYVMKQLYAKEYEMGDMTNLFMSYFTEELTDEFRAAYFLENRLGGVSTRGAVRDAVYKAYTGNKVITTLEATRDFNSSDLTELRKACCYAFADYLCRLAGDFVDVTENPYYTVFSSEYTTLAPGITQEIKYATTADNKQTVFYIATADITREDVDIHANYNDHMPENGWAMQRVQDQAEAAQAYHSDPTNENYIENFNVIASVNGSGFNMQTGEPSGILVMHGKEYHPINANGFIGMLKNGEPVIGTTEEYNTIYKGQVRDAIAIFGTTLIKDGKVSVTANSSYYNDRAGRTAAGITKTGKFVFMVMDGRQEPHSCGGSMQEIAQVMLEAGCVQAVNLDGGGSTTYVAKQPGEEALSVINSPSDGFARSVSTSLFMVSTAPSSTAFDHAIVECPMNYLTVGTSLQLTAAGVSATGNAAEMPEGYTWAVADTRWAEITQDGVLTAKRLGDITVYLMLDDVVIGSHTLYSVIPNNVYFTRKNIDAVYGSTVTLPVKALYDNKEVAINSNDLVFELSNSAAGFLDSNTLIVAESTVLKNVTVTVRLPSDDLPRSSIQVSLYNQGEASFDFDKAVGGNRQLAWDRKVTNAVTEDNITYEIVDPEQDMTVAYTFAIDMTQISIPPQLEDLTGMLPGADMENASAWMFLLQLAERISPLSEITPVIRFDKSFNVDYSGLTLLNEYFELKGTTFDEEKNELTMKLRWIDQTKAIDPETANPLCIVSGIKVTPKEDANWDSKGRLSVVNGGEISYKIYMRASALYSFAQKPENQEVYGIYPYVNPDDSKDAGGYFGSTYAKYDDTFTMVRALKNGWVTEEGGFAYYVDGVKFTGVCKADGLYYDFGEDGINVGKTPYSGLFTEDGSTYYAKLGEPITGWQSVGDDWYFFDWQTCKGADGTLQQTIEKVKVTYQMEDGKLIQGYWHNDGKGLQYFYGPYLYKQSWQEIDGKTYFFDNYYACTGLFPTRAAHAVVATWCVFDENGVYLGEAEDGLHWYKGDLYYIVDASCVHTGLYQLDGAYYYFRSDYKAVVGESFWISNTGGKLPAGYYRFGADGKIVMTTELVQEDGVLYYYLEGRRAANAGLILVDGSYYYIESGAIAAANKTAWVGTTNGLLPAGSYRFAADGKMILDTALVEENGGLYYYKDGKLTYNAGLVEFGGDYYCIDPQARAVTNTTLWVSNTNKLLPAGYYEFGADGKMVRHNGVVGGKYYVDGVGTAAGLVQFEGDYYFATSGGSLITNQMYWVGTTNGLLPAGYYRFGADGKINMATELVQEDGFLFYYLNGRRAVNAGMILVDGSYYYIVGDAKAVTDQSIWVSNTNGLVTAGIFRFGADGKAIMTTELVMENGALYYYQNGRMTYNAGLVKLDGAYYFIDGSAKAVTNMTQWVTKAKANGLWPEGNYDFGADGKMIIHNGVVGGYYYVNGVRTAAGLVKENGNYYYALGGGRLVMDQSFWINITNGMLKVGMYRFDSEGKIIMTTGLDTEDGVIYYYRDGLRTAAGLVQLDGSYYYIEGGGIAAADKMVWVSNTNGLVTAGNYRFAADGKMIMDTAVVEVDGVLYYFRNGKMTYNAGLVEYLGDYYLIDPYAKAVTNSTQWIGSYNSNGLRPQGNYQFGADGKMIIHNGVAGDTYYVDGVPTAAGLVKENGNYYYALGNGKLVMNQTFWTYQNHGMLKNGFYRFDSEGKIIMTTELVEEDGNLYFYREGIRAANAGLIQIDGSYYHIDGAGAAVKERMFWVSNTNGLKSAGMYRFGADGKMLTDTEVAKVDGVYYYFQDGKLTYNVGLVKYEGAYYFIDGAGQAVTNATQWVTKAKSNGLWPEGSYDFDAEGKLIIYNGVVGGYYYKDGIRTAAGLVYENGHYYYALGGGMLVMNQSFWINITNGLLSQGMYRFDEAGRIIIYTGLVEEDGVLYYYKNGLRTTAGLIQLDGSYYYIEGGGIAAAGKSVWVSATNGLVSAGVYRFAADGKMFTGTAVVEENGELYYYKNGRLTYNVGIVKYEDAYYFIDEEGKAVTNTVQWVTSAKANGMWPEGNYEFGADGKMIIHNGIAGGTYYVNGIPTAAGLLYIDGNYYYALGGGRLVMNETFWIVNTNGLLKNGYYRFDSEGKIIMTTELVEEDGVLHYYTDGIMMYNIGIVESDGAFYFIGADGTAITNATQWVTAAKSNGLVSEGNHTFGEDGKMIA